MRDTRDLASLSFICALMCENDALEYEYLAQVAERAMVEYRLGNVLKLVSPELYRTWAVNRREAAEHHLKKAISLEDAANTNG